MWSSFAQIITLLATVGKNGMNNDDLAFLPQSVDNDGGEWNIIEFNDIEGIRLQPANSLTSSQWRVAAKAFFDGSKQNITGWSQFEVITNPSIPDPYQAYAAGWAEGHLTKGLIDMHWQNTVAGYCEGNMVKPSNDGQYCKRLHNYLTENVAWMNEEIAEKREKEPLWHQIALFLERLNAMEDGYRGVVKKPTTIIKNPLKSFLMFQLNGGLGDLEHILQKAKRSNPLGTGSCSAQIKLFPDSQNLMSGHVTWGAYQAMMKMLKKLTLNYHETAAKGSSPVASTEIAMSSYPGYLFSLDDFYLTSQKLMVTETTIENFNETSYKAAFNPRGKVLTPLRAMAANSLAKNGEEWAHHFADYNSGTYNNQWMVVDYKLAPKHRAKQPWEHKALKEERMEEMSTKSGLFTVLEEMPGKIAIKDMSSRFHEKIAAWRSYNIPAFDEIYKYSMTDVQAASVKADIGNAFSYGDCPRAKIFDRFEKNWPTISNVDENSRQHELQSFIKVMRYNDFKNDPLALCPDCRPDHNGEFAISARSDLNDAKGKYPLEFLGRRSHGGHDLKIVDTDMLAQESLQFVAIAGPTFDQQPCFKWSTSGWTFKDTPHYGHPDEWCFGPVKTNWRISRRDTKF